MQILAIDPGTTESAYVLYNARRHVIEAKAKIPNAEMHDVFKSTPQSYHLVIEMIASYGMPVGSEVFETCVWIGRFLEQAERCGLLTERMFRKTVKMWLCQTNKAKDANIRAALIDKFGGSKAKAIGLKKTPGPLYGVKADIWAALAVAVTFAEWRGSESPIV